MWQLSSSSNFIWKALAEKVFVRTTETVVAFFFFAPEIAGLPSQIGDKTLQVMFDPKYGCCYVFLYVDVQNTRGGK